MKADDLLEFINTKMRMSHVYQPLLIRSLLDAGGQASLRQVAADFVAEDEAHLRYYEERIKAMPLKVLRNNGVCSYQNGVLSLDVENLSFEQRATLRAACEQRIAAFLEQRGVGAWNQGALNIEPVGESLRFEILSGIVCASSVVLGRNVVGSSSRSHSSPLEGRDELIDNLLILCASCNRGKRRDDTDSS